MILALGAVIIGALVTSIAFLPPPGRPNVTVTLLGYTNDATGTRLARIAVNNLSASAIRRAALYHIQIPTPTGWTNLSYSHSLGSEMLGAGASQILTVPSPTNQPSWRISFLTYPDAGKGQVVKWVVTDPLLRIGLKPRYRIMFYEIHGDWIEGEK
ncbi:hypothetical protein [Pedosphaera parvula]|uniref:Uncharacterized protein n=1 Tax=Pedosphaera parvula (strain Ellin514) TaxID=320771 RepID=B9XQ28_PEDPL|nr:hypothetical protein [Pedosphaera parvula]EEF58032.1 hypothetical protein Cflav_PD1169 [Pedosphaera parvula Ellin514]